MYRFVIISGYLWESTEKSEYYQQSLHHPSFEHERRQSNYFSHNAAAMLTVLSNILLM